METKGQKQGKGQTKTYQPTRNYRKKCKLLNKEISKTESTLAQEKRDLKKEDYSLTKEKEASSKTILFCSFQICHKRHKNNLP